MYPGGPSDKGGGLITVCDGILLYANLGFGFQAALSTCSDCKRGRGLPGTRSIHALPPHD